MKLPAFQFYVGDWRKDPGVQSLNFHDRGVWFEMLCLMHESESRGKLILNGRPMPEDALARLLGLDKQIVTTTITTLLTYGVASKCEETGAIISRRMIRDEHIRQVRADAGKMGGNPALLKQKPTTGVKQIPTPSSSSSISSSEREKDPPPLKVSAPQFDFSDTMPSATAAQFDKIRGQINELNPSWKRRPHFTKAELDMLLGNSKIICDITDADWSLLRDYMFAIIPEDWGRFYQPDGRLKLIENITDVLTHADRWSRKIKSLTRKEGAA